MTGQDPQKYSGINPSNRNDDGRVLNGPILAPQFFAVRRLTCFPQPLFNWMPTEGSLLQNQSFFLCFSFCVLLRDTFQVCLLEGKPKGNMPVLGPPPLTTHLGLSFFGATQIVWWFDRDTKRKATSFFFLGGGGPLKKDPQQRHSFGVQGRAPSCSKFAAAGHSNRGGRRHGQPIRGEGVCHGAPLAMQNWRKTSADVELEDVLVFSPKSRTL